VRACWTSSASVSPVSVFQAVDVARRLGQRPRELLDLRVPIQLQWIELLVLGHVSLVAVEYLRLSGQFQAAQLVAQAHDRRPQLFQVELDLVHLLRQA